MIKQNALMIGGEGGMCAKFVKNCWKCRVVYGLLVLMGKRVSKDSEQIIPSSSGLS